MEIDQKVYFSDSEVVTLAYYQDRKRTASKRKKARDRMDKQAESKRSQDTVKKNFYSAPDAASFLGISAYTLRRWIVKHDIQRKMITTDKTRLYIAWDDVLKLADLHKRKVTSGVSPVNMAEDLKELKEKVRVLASDVEDIKHDLRILGKRAIFIM